eukprot:TRINITY_DN113053_c0_g1_i1.p1 TRINITY_DN113053_c0_g1~~TRINITY_DN113053_c0_g1_i1.p1  ORF type:complete len:377 (-),score=159.38 TRINITY_DN113053_c0_g1_i1:16-1146(-)
MGRGRGRGRKKYYGRRPANSAPGSRFGFVNSPVATPSAAQCVVVTTDLGNEMQSARELVDWFNDVSEQLYGEFVPFQIDLSTRKESAAASSEEEEKKQTKKNEEEGEEQQHEEEEAVQKDTSSASASVSDALAAELAELRAAAGPASGRRLEAQIDGDGDGEAESAAAEKSKSNVITVSSRFAEVKERTINDKALTLIESRDPKVDLARVVQHAVRSVYEHGALNSRHTIRVVPCACVTVSKMPIIEKAAREYLARAFADQDPTHRFAFKVEVKKRAKHEGLRSIDLAKALTLCIPKQLQWRIDYKQPEIVLSVQVIGRFTGMTLLDGKLWTKTKQFNVRYSYQQYQARAEAEKGRKRKLDDDEQADASNKRQKPN